MRELNETSKICPFCHSEQLKSFSAYAWDSPVDTRVSVIECCSCRFAWQHPTIRSATQSTSVFEDLYKDQGRTASKYFDPVRKMEIAKLELDFISELPCANRSLLDIGAGSGQFAKVAAKAGWHVVAVDPALDPAKITDRVGSLQFVQGTTDDLLGDQKYDVVTLWDVIEHAVKPIELIETAKRFVKPNGWLVLETGNYESADRLLAGERHWIYQLDHRWYFTPSSIYRIVDNFGLKDIRFCKKVLRPGWSGSLLYQGPSLKYLAKMLLTRKTPISESISTYLSLRTARKWSMGGLGILAIAARCP